MKKTLLLTAMTLALTFTSGAGAQMMGGGPNMMQGDDQQQVVQPPQDMEDMMYPGMMGGCGMGPGMMGGYGMGPGMMGGFGMGPGMMGGYGMGPRMMGGYGMGPGMMGNYGYGMGPRMMGGDCECRRHMRGNRFGYGQGWNSADEEQNQKFLDETREMRKKLNDMRFDYREMLRNPKTTMKDTMAMERKMFDLRQQILEKAPQK